MDAIFTKEMKKDYTIILPNMSPIHFKILQKIFDNHGFKTILLGNSESSIIRCGLEYVHNDMCYPCLLVIGQIIDAINKGLIDKNKCAIAITQTGGGCRASNYYNLLKKALKRANLGEIPVISLNLKGMNTHPGFMITPIMMIQAASAIFYGDLIMVMANQTRPYEVNKGDTDRITNKWVDIIGEKFRRNKDYFWKNIKKNMNAISDDFASIAVDRKPKVKVGIVGEIYMKFSPLGNSNLQGFLENEDCEVMLPPMIGFIFYSLGNTITDRKYYGHSIIVSKLVERFLIPLLKKIENWSNDAIARHPEYSIPATYEELKEYSKPFIDQGCKMGEGWLLTAEMVELINKGYSNIVCTQPFGCLPNHIVGKGMIRPLKKSFPEANIVPIDYDPSATKVNQENRIKLMLAIANESLSNRDEKLY